MSEKTVAVAKAPKKKAVSRKEMSKFGWALREMKRNWIAYLMVAPFYVIFLMFTVLPVVISIFLSFTSFNMLVFISILEFS